MLLLDERDYTNSKQNPLSDSGFQVSFMVWLGTNVVSISSKQTIKKAFDLYAITIGELGNLTQICFHMLLLVREAGLQSHVFYCIFDVTFWVEKFTYIYPFDCE